MLRIAGTFRASALFQKSGCLLFPCLAQFDGHAVIQYDNLNPLATAPTPALI